MISSTEHFKGLPDGLRILEGLADYHAGRPGINACLLRIAAPRLERAGLMSPTAVPDGTAELELYEILMTESGNAYGRYNSLLRELVSFEHALDHCLSAGK